MKIIILSVVVIFFGAFLFAACNSPEDKITTSGSTNDTLVKNDLVPSPATSYEGCYQMVIARDTAYLELKQEGERFSGPLVYKRYEKDSNKGSVVLTQTNDRLEGWYTFQSEGMTSVRQIVFKTENNALSEAYGDLNVKGDTAFFKYPTTLQFESKHPFNKVNCE